MKNYRDYNDDDNSMSAEAIIGVVKFDWLIAFAISAAVFALLWVWSYPGLYPASWGDLAVASGTRPPRSVLPGLWRLVSMYAFKAMGVANGLTVYKMLGRVVGSVSAGLVYVFFRQWLSISIRHRKQMARRRLFTVRVAAAVAALAFACSEPFWRAAQVFTPVTMTFFLVMVAMTLFAMFMRNGSMPTIYGCAFLLGVISAETPVGFLAVLVGWGSYFFITRYGELFAVPLINPATAQVSKWHLTFLFVLGLLLAAGGNCYSFFASGGLRAIGDPGLSVLPLQYITSHWGLFGGAASPVGWLFLSVIIILPCFVSMAMLPKATDEEHFLPYGIGLVYVVSCLFAVSQLSPVQGLWIWGWEFSQEPIVHSQLLMMVMAMLAAVSIMGAIVVLGVDGFCRDHKFIAQQQFGFSQADEDGAYDEEFAMPKPRRLSRRAKARLGKLSRAVVVTFMLLVVPAMTVPSRHCGKVREMLAVIQDYIDQVLLETEGRTFVVTDGKFDAGLEVAALAKGRTLLPLSIETGRGSYDVFLRMRGIDDGESQMAASTGTSSLLRTWVLNNQQFLANCCVQLGFEIWKSECRPFPVMLGVSSRPGENDAAFISRCMEGRKSLLDGVVDFYSRHRNIDSNDHLVESLFEMVQWRISRMATFRSKVYGLAGDKKHMEEEENISKELDNRNASVQRLREALTRAQQNAPRQLTPQEGLRKALENRDFAVASQYASSVLKSHPENVEANFAMGMLYANQGQFFRAEEHIARCLVLAPRQPAAYNNLAMIQIELGKFDAAEKNAMRALELAPGSTEIMDTVERVKRAREAASTNSLPAAVSAPAAPTGR